METVYIYKTFDGKEFLSKEEALTYENNFYQQQYNELKTIVDNITKENDTLKTYIHKIKNVCKTTQEHNNNTTEINKPLTTTHSITTKKQTKLGGKNILHLLPHTFTYKQLMDVRKEKGMDIVDKKCKKQIKNWIDRKYITKDNLKQIYIKTY